MWKLLFVPLFHDASIVGRILSFLFRLGRIFLGLVAFAIATLLIVLAAFYWFVLPGLAVKDGGAFHLLVLFSGLGLFILHVSLHPHKKTWQIREGGEFWQASQVKKKNLSIKKLLRDPAVQILLELVEAKPAGFISLEIADKDQVGLSAYNLAKQTGSPHINANHFFMGVLENTPQIDQLLIKLGRRLEDFKQALSFLELKRSLWRRVYIWDDDFTIHHLKGVNRGWLGASTPALDSFSTDLTKQIAREGIAGFIGNKIVMNELIHVLSSASNRNVILVGPPGSGKSSLVKYLAKQIVSGDAPQALATKRLVQLDLTKLLSSVTTQGELAERVKNIFEEVSFSGNIVMVIEEIHNLGLGEAGSQFNLYALMESYLESANFQFIGTTEPENYVRVIEKNGSFARIFTKIEVAPVNEQEAFEILQRKAIALERTNGVQISTLALRSCVELGKLVHDRVLPDAAISILEEAVAHVGKGWVTKEVVERVASTRTKIPVGELHQADKDLLLNLEKLIHQRFVGQEQAVKVVADSLRRNAAGFKEVSRPIGSFLFVGPTGVGKTELAKILSEIYFKGKGAFLRFDMPEYQEESGASRLIGATGEGGQLTEAVRNNPYSLILLDEFEKMNPKVMALFLQVLEDGRLTDGAGKTINFSSTIIIATSNAASLTIAQGLQQGKTLEGLDHQVNNKLLQVFKPELINRFDDVVLFKPLSLEELKKIVELKLSKLKEQLKDKQYQVEFDPALIAELVKRSYDPVMGARPLRRLIQDTLEAKLSKMILENKLVKAQPYTLGLDIL